VRRQQQRPQTSQVTSNSMRGELCRVFYFRRSKPSHGGRRWRGAAQHLHVDVGTLWRELAVRAHKALEHGTQQIRRLPTAANRESSGARRRETKRGGGGYGQGQHLRPVTLLDELQALLKLFVLLGLVGRRPSRLLLVPTHVQDLWTSRLALPQTKTY
jgi:hypothetical protein